MNHSIDIFTGISEKSDVPVIMKPKASRLKYRVWDSRDTKGATTWEMLYDVQNHPMWFDFLDYPRVYELMQSTGHIDKNKKEIYEGDIIKCDASDGNGHEEILIGEVKFEDFEYVIYTTNDKWPCASFNVLETKEIIGNIYENPDILNTK